MSTDIPTEDTAGRHRRQLLGALFLFLLTSWLATGTLAPYAATHHAPLVLPPCSYLANLDHYHFRGPFLMLDGAPAEQWNQSQVLRRILHPLLSYPLMKMLGFEFGGVATSILLHLVAAGLFLSFVRKRWGLLASERSAWLLSSYPGIAYWIGLPYSYAFIVPASLLATILVAWIYDQCSLTRAALGGLVLGILFTGYDLFTIYGAAAVFACLFRKRFLSAGIVLLGIAAPIALSLHLLSTVYNAPLTNANSDIFSVILGSYLSVPDFAAWWPLLASVPLTAVKVFFFSNFIILPATFLFTMALAKSPRLQLLEGWEWAILFGGLAFFLFNNLAPPYQHSWQMRGDWLSRLYQPIFPIFIVVLSRATSFRWSAIKSVHVFRVVVLANALLSLGPVVQSPLSDYAYHHFYRHAFEHHRMSTSIERYGARPLGFCKRRSGE